MRKIYLAFILVMISLIANSQVKDWNDPTTWNGNVPSSNNSVTINSGDSIKLTSDVKIRNLTVQSMAYLDLNGYQLEFTKKLTNHGVINSISNSIIYANRADEIKGSQAINIHNLIWRDDIDIEVDVNIINTVYCIWGDLNANNHLIFLPGSYVSDGYTLDNIKDDVRFQKIIYKNKWNYLSNPLQTTSFQSWNNYIPTFGFPGSNLPGWNISNVYTYSEYGYSIGGTGWNALVNANQSITPTTSFILWSTIDTIVEISNPITNNNINITITNTTSPLGDSFEGWNLITNPYLGKLDFEALPKTRIEDALYVWDEFAKIYATYINGISTNGGVRFIPPGKSFFVKAKSAGNLQLNTNHIDPATNRPVIAPNHMKIKSWKDNVSDEVAVYHADVQIGFHDSLDAENRSNVGFDSFIYDPFETKHYSIKATNRPYSVFYTNVADSVCFESVYRPIYVTDGGDTYSILGNTCIQPTTTRLSIKYIETKKKIRNKEEKPFLIRL